MNFLESLDTSALRRSLAPTTVRTVTAAVSGTLAKVPPSTTGARILAEAFNNERPPAVLKFAAVPVIPVPTSFVPPVSVAPSVAAASSPSAANQADPTTAARVVLADASGGAIDEPRHHARLAVGLALAGALLFLLAGR